MEKLFAVLIESGAVYCAIWVRSPGCHRDRHGSHHTMLKC